MGGVGALLAAKVDLGVAVAAGGAGHRSGLWFGLGRFGLGGGSVGGSVGDGRGARFSGGAEGVRGRFGFGA